ncbi:MAG TPA: hotdog domain-containing protein [Candidatus Methylomirabilis sp.]|nr:hotdog domain-containing protein [Candidatus Methylomirabilis sp.]
MPSVRDTAIEMTQFVLPEHAGAPGQIHGGRMMEWITQAGTIAASRVARGNVVLGAMEDLDFLHPVLVGSIAILRAQVEYVGRSSLEVGVRVTSENPATGDWAVTLSSHLVYVSVDEDGQPRPVSEKIVAAGSEEEALVAAAVARREERLARFARKQERRGVPEEAEDFRWKFESSRIVRPSEVLFRDFMFVGKLLFDIDEAGGILGVRYTRGSVMTACLDAMDFYAPVRTREVLTFKAGLNHVGRTSKEIGVKVLAEAPWTGEVRHTCTAYLSFVHLSADRKPQPVPAFTPETPGEVRRWKAALLRREARLARVKRLKASLGGR